VINESLCNNIKMTRTQANRTRSISEARGIETMDVLNLNIDEDKDYEDEYQYLVRIQEIDLEEQDGDDQTEFNEDLENSGLSPSLPELPRKKNIFKTGRLSRMRPGRNSFKGKGENKNYGGGKKKGGVKNKGGGINNGSEKNKKGGKKKGEKKKNGGSGKNKKNIPIPNKYGVTIKSWGETRLFNLRDDPEERIDISADNVELIEKLKARAVEHFLNLQPQFTPPDDPRSNPLRWGGFWSPGWCNIHTIKD
jgi:hypothetical protein